jgi:hypothetical protein
MPRKMQITLQQKEGLFGTTFIPLGEGFPLEGNDCHVSPEPASRLIGDEDARIDAHGPTGAYFIREVLSIEGIDAIYACSGFIVISLKPEEIADPTDTKPWYAVLETIARVFDVVPVVSGHAKWFNIEGRTLRTEQVVFRYK